MKSKKKNAIYGYITATNAKKNLIGIYFERVIRRNAFMKEDYKPNEGLLKTAPGGPKVKHARKRTFIFYVFLTSVLLFFSTQFIQVDSWKSTILFLCGFIVWILAEYILHRFVFQNNYTFTFLNKAHYMLHGLNSSKPEGFDKIYMRPVTGTVFFFALFIIYFLFLKSNTIIFISGLISGYLFYAFIYPAIPKKTGKLIFHKLLIRHLKLQYKPSTKINGSRLSFLRILFRTPSSKQKQ